MHGVCVTEGNYGMVGAYGDPGMEANGIRRVSLLACMVLVHLIKTVTPVVVMDTSPLVR